MFHDISIKIIRRRERKIGAKGNARQDNMKYLFLDEQQEKYGDKEATGRTTPRLQPPKRDQTQAATAVARGNRFGFRQNVVRPATGITPKYNEYDNVNNNVTASSENEKRRSKSASAPRSSVSFAQPPTVKTANEERSHTNA